MTQIAENASQDKRPTIEILNLFPLQGEWTEEDYFNLPDTNHYIELSEGRLIFLDMQSTTHQRVVGKLYRLMADFVDNNALGEVGLAPLPVHLWKGKVREPDIVFMSDAHKDRIREKYWGVPDLVVEVLSKSNVNADRVEKFAEYVQAGISEYWIVDPEAKTIEVYTLKKSTYDLFGKWEIGEIAHSNLLSSFEAAVDTIVG